MNAQSSPALAIDGLRVEYPLANGSVFTAVENASLVIQPGEIHALVGESGAGKTTIGNTVMGLLEKPESLMRFGTALSCEERRGAFFYTKADT